jgi:hypothetical protein
MPKSEEQQRLWRVAALAGVLAHDGAAVTANEIARHMRGVAQAALYALARDGLVVRDGDGWRACEGVSLDVEI